MAAAAAVRAVAGGSETVPTVQVGDRWLVNPTVEEVCCIRGGLGMTVIKPQPHHRCPERRRTSHGRGKNKALVRRWIEHGRQEAMRGNLDVVHQYFADHYHDHTPLHPEQPGVHGVKELVADTGQATPDLRMEVVHVAADGDLVFVHWQATATHEGQHQVTKHVRHLEPSGEEETVSGIILYRIEGDNLVEG